MNNIIKKNLKPRKYLISYLNIILSINNRPTNIYIYNMNQSRTSSKLVLSNSISSANDLLEIISLIKSNKKNETSNFITPLLKMRKHLIDWLIVVSKKLKLSNQCYFLAVEIFDNVLEKLLNINSYQLHLLAVVCLIIASKYEEIKFIGIRTAVRSICQNKYSEDEIKEAELFILRVLKFKIRRIYFEEFAYVILSEFDNNGRQKLSSANEYVFKASIFIYKLVLQNYELYRNYDELTLYFAILYFCISNEMKHEKLKNKFNFFQFLEFANTFNIKSKSLISYSEMIKIDYFQFLDDNEDREFLRSCEYLSLINSAL